MWRLRVRPSQPGLRGLRETSPGPTTWVRPATGWWGRMNAGRKTLRNQGRTARALLSVSRRRSRGLRKTPQWGAERRAGPRYGSAVPSRRRDGSDRKTGQWVRRSAPANFGAPLPSYWDCEGFETDNLARQPAGMRRAAMLPHGSTHARRKDDAGLHNQTAAGANDARLLRFARNDG